MNDLVATKNRSLTNKTQNTLAFPTWSNWIDEMFNRNLPSVFTSNFNTGLTLPGVNIRETNDAYFVDMAVPGLKKSDFHIDLDKKILSISTDIQEKEEEHDADYLRMEFGYASFKRSFSLPETISEDKIKAEYKDGILSIHLPKKDEAIQKPARKIKIS